MTELERIEQLELAAEEQDELLQAIVEAEEAAQKQAEIRRRQATKRSLLDESDEKP